jgi:glycine oxidase
MREAADVAVVGTGVVGLAVALELLRRGLRVSVVGPRGGPCRGQGTRAAGAMLSTFSEIEPHHDQQRVRMETAERLAAHDAYPAWLEQIAAMGGGTVETPSGTWVLAPAGRGRYLGPIAAAARAAGHQAEEHDAASIPGLNAPASSAGALWLPTEARVDSAALMEALSRAAGQHPGCSWSPTAVPALTSSATAITTRA